MVPENRPENFMPQKRRFTTAQIHAAHCSPWNTGSDLSQQEEKVFSTPALKRQETLCLKSLSLLVQMCKCFHEDGIELNNIIDWKFAVLFYPMTIFGSFPPLWKAKLTSTLWSQQIYQFSDEDVAFLSSYLRWEEEGVVANKKHKEAVLILKIHFTISVLPFEPLM